MPENIIERLKELLEEGKNFTFGSCCSKDHYGYASAFKMEYILWKTQVDVILQSEFGTSSPIYNNFKKGESVPVIGYGKDYFDSSHNYILAAVETALKIRKTSPTESIDAKTSGTLSKKVFIVHGHDELLKSQVENFITEIGLEPVVLHRKPDEGLTLIEKFEKHSDVGYAIIILTPDDIGYSTTEESKPESDRKKELRARQNVIFEFGFFVGKLGRNRVCCLYRENVQLPTDISGIVYKKIHKEISEVAYPILKDLKAAGYSVNI